MRVRKKRVHVDVLLVRVLLLADHPADALVHQQLLMRLQVSQIARQVGDDRLDKGLRVTIVHLDKHLLGQLGNLQVRLTGHVLDSRVALMHELMQLVHDRLQKGPMVDQEAGKLANHVHNVRGDEGFRVLGLTLLAQVEELLDHGAKELVFSLNVHAARNGTERPAELVQLLKINRVFPTCRLHNL